MANRYDRQSRYHKSPRGKYVRQYTQARRRGIEFCLSFEDWWEIWQCSGKWEKRGNKKGLYVMARYGDEGPYSADNVYIELFEENLRFARVKVQRLHSAKSDTVLFL